MGDGSMANEVWLWPKNKKKQKTTTSSLTRRLLAWLASRQSVAMGAHEGLAGPAGQPAGSVCPGGSMVEPMRIHRIPWMGPITGPYGANGEPRGAMGNSLERMGVPMGPMGGIAEPVGSHGKAHG